MASERLIFNRGGSLVDDAIPRHAKDVVQKLISDIFASTLTSWYGLSDARIVDTLPPTVPTLTIQEHLLDRVFLTDTGEILHLEFQSTPEVDLRRFLTYAVALINTHNRPVRTVVVYLYPTSLASSRLERRSVQYQVENVMIADKAGPAIWQHLAALPPQDWSDPDILDLTFYPFMDDPLSRSERALRAATLATFLPKPIQQRIGALILGLTSTFLDEKVLKSMKEVLKMNDLVRELEEEAILRGWNKGLEQGLEQGLQQGLAQGRRKGILTSLEVLIGSRFGDVPAALKTRMADLTEAQLLNLMPHISMLESLDNLREILQKESQ